MLVRRRTGDSSWSAGSLTPNSLARRSQPISASAWRRLASGCDVGGRAASRPSMRYRDVEQAIFWGEPCSTVAMVPTCSLRPRTRRAAFGGGLWPSLTFAARAGLPKGRSGRRDVGFRSNNRMTSGRCRSQPGNEGLAVAHDGEDGTQQLAQGGDQGDLGQLATADQAIVECLEPGIATYRAEQRHPQGGAQAGVADRAEAGSLAAAFARLLETGHHTDVGGERRRIGEAAEIAEFGDEADRGVG